MIPLPAGLLKRSDFLAAAALLGSVVSPRALRLPPVERRELDGGRADLYLPERLPAPGVVLVLGALREGRRYPLLESTARAIAGCGFATLVPELGRLRSLILGMDALDDLVDAARELPEQPGVARSRVGLIGFSLGASLALLAAGDTRLRQKVACVAAMGSYFRLTDMLAAAAGGYAGPGGRRMTLAAPSAFAVAASLVAQLPEPDRSFLEQTIDRARDSPVEALSRVDPQSLGNPSRAILELLRSPDPGRTAELLGAVEGLGAVMAALSPEGAIGAIDCPAWVLHDARDSFVPFGEFTAMRQAASGRANFRFLEIRLLEHTEPARPALHPGTLVREYVPGLAALFRFAHGPLSAVRRAARHS